MNSDPRAERPGRSRPPAGRRVPKGNRAASPGPPDPGGCLVLPAGRHPAVLLGVVRLKPRAVPIAEDEAVLVTRVLLAWQTGLVRPDGVHHFVTQAYVLSSREESPLQELARRWRGERLGGDMRPALRAWLGAAAWLTTVADPGDADADAVLAAVDPLPQQFEPPRASHPWVFRDTDNPIPKIPWHPRILAADQSVVELPPGR